METTNQSSGIISGTTLSQSGEIVLAKFEALTSHAGDSATQIPSEQIGEQVLGYLEVQPSDVQLVQDSNTIFLQPQEIEIDGEHLILTQGEEAGEIIVVVSTDQEHSTDQAVAELAQGAVVNATMMHAESGDNKPRMFVVNQSNAQFDVVSDDGRVTSIHTAHVESEQLLKSVPVEQRIIIPVQKNQKDTSNTNNVEKAEESSEVIENEKIPVDHSEDSSKETVKESTSSKTYTSACETKDRKLMQLACIAQEIRKENNQTNNHIQEKPSENLPCIEEEKYSEKTEMADKSNVTLEDTSKEVPSVNNVLLSNYPSTSTEIPESSVNALDIDDPIQITEPKRNTRLSTEAGDTSESSMNQDVVHPIQIPESEENIELSTEEIENTNDLNQNNLHVDELSEMENVVGNLNEQNNLAVDELRQIESVGDFSQQDNLHLDELSQISQNDQSVPNESSILTIPENTSLVVPERSTEQNTVSTNSTSFSQESDEISKIESEYGENRVIRVSESVESTTNSYTCSSLPSEIKIPVSCLENETTSFISETEKEDAKNILTCSVDQNSVLENCNETLNRDTETSVNLSLKGDAFKFESDTDMTSNQKYDKEKSFNKYYDVLNTDMNDDIASNVASIDDSVQTTLSATSTSENTNNSTVTTFSGNNQSKEQNLVESEKILHKSEKNQTDIDRIENDTKNEVNSPEEMKLSDKDTQIMEDAIKCVQDVINTTEVILSQSNNEFERYDKSVNVKESIIKSSMESSASHKIVTNENSADSSFDQVVPQIDVTDVNTKNSDATSSKVCKNLTGSAVKPDNTTEYNISGERFEVKCGFKMATLKQPISKEIITKKNIVDEGTEVPSNTDSHFESTSALWQNDIERNSKLDRNIEKYSGKKIIQSFPVLTDKTKEDSGFIRSTAGYKARCGPVLRTYTRQKQSRHPVVIHLRSSIAKKPVDEIEKHETSCKAVESECAEASQNKPLIVENKLFFKDEDKIVKSKEKLMPSNEEKLKVISEVIQNCERKQKQNEETLIQSSEISLTPIIDGTTIQNSNEKISKEELSVQNNANISKQIQKLSDSKMETNTTNIVKNNSETEELNLLKSNDTYYVKSKEQLCSSYLEHQDILPLHKENNLISNETVIKSDENLRQEKSECLTPKIQKQFQLLISPEKSDVEFEVDLTSIKSKISLKLQFDSLSEINSDQQSESVIMENEKNKPDEMDETMQFSFLKGDKNISPGKSSKEISPKTPKHNTSKRKMTRSPKSAVKVQKTNDEKVKSKKKDSLLGESPKTRSRKRKSQIEVETPLKQQKVNDDSMSSTKEMNEIKDVSVKSWSLRSRNRLSNTHKEFPEIPDAPQSVDSEIVSFKEDKNQINCNKSSSSPIATSVENSNISLVPLDQSPAYDSDRSEISEDLMTDPPVLMTRNKFLNSNYLSTRGRRQYTRKHVRSKSFNLSVQKVQSPRKYSSKTKVLSTSLTVVPEKKHERSKTESSLSLNMEIEDCVETPVKVCDFRIRCQTPSTPSEKVGNYSCVGCQFQTSRVQNLIHHYRRKCLYTGPDAFHWDLDQLEGARKEACKENGCDNTKQTIGSANKTVIGSDIQMTPAKKNYIKSGHTMDLIINSDSDSDDLPPAFDTPSKSKYGFGEDDVVWVEWKNLHWPALVRKIYMKQKKTSVMFIDTPSGKKGIRVPIKKISTFDNAERNKKYLSAGRVTADADILVKAVQKAEDFLRKRCLGININTLQFFGGLDDLADDISDIGSSASIPSEPSISTRERHISEASSSCSASPALRLLQEESTKEDSVILPKRNAPDPDVLARRKERRKHQNAKLLQCIKSGKVETHLLGVYRNTISSERHNLFHSNLPSERNQLKHVSWFGPIDDEEQQEEIYEYCLQLFKTTCEYKETFDIVSYIFEVWVPEAIVRAVSRVRRVNMIQAEEIFGKGVHLSKAEKEESKRELENFHLTEEERQEHRERMVDTLRIAGMKEEIIQSLDL